jgi:DNA-binding NarL/FixJ family response regulator
VRVEEDAGTSAGPIRVLLADDDPGFLDALSALIGQLPNLLVVGIAHDGLEAIELTELLEPDAVVIDLHMPMLDGVTAVARLRHDHPTLSLIAVTGDEGERLHRAVLESGADTVLVKDALAEALPTRLAEMRAAL